MKKQLISLFLVLLFLVGIAVVSHAAPVPGVYTTGLTNMIVTVQSLSGGDFGVGDISSSISEDGVTITSSGLTRTVQTFTPWVQIDDTHLTRNMYTEREGGSSTILGEFYGEPAGTVYNLTVRNTSTASHFYTRASIADDWIFDYSIGTSTSYSRFLTEPFTATTGYEYAFDSSDYTTVGDYTYITFEATALVTTIDPVPIPGSMLLFGVGLVGLVGLNRKRK